MPSRLTKRTAAGAAVAAALLLAGAGCPSSNGDSSGTSDSLPSCPSASEVNDTLRAELDSPDEKTNGSTRTCTYKVAPGGDEVVISFTTGVSAADFQAAEESPGPAGEDAQPINGLGDAAYSMTSGEAGSEVTMISVLSGTTEVSVQAPLSLKFVEDLARKLLP